MIEAEIYANNISNTPVVTNSQANAVRSLIRDARDNASTASPDESLDILDFIHHENLDLSPSPPTSPTPAVSNVQNNSIPSAADNSLDASNMQNSSIPPAADNILAASTIRYPFRTQDS